MAGLKLQWRESSEGADRSQPSSGRRSLAERTAGSSLNSGTTRHLVVLKGMLCWESGGVGSRVLRSMLAGIV
jgi:hypothetical protein